MRMTLMIAGLLAGCSNLPTRIDDPANPAQLGTRRVVTTAESLTEVGFTISRNNPHESENIRENAKSTLASLSGRSTLVCGEPRIDTADAVSSLVPGTKMRECSVSDLTREGATQAAVLQCMGDPGSKQQSSNKITITSTADLAPAEATAQTELYIQHTRPTGETRSGTISLTHRFERIGDCA